MSKFGELISAQTPVLIDFYTDWNDPSISMHPVIRDEIGRASCRERV